MNDDFLRNVANMPSKIQFIACEIVENILSPGGLGMGLLCTTLNNNASKNCILPNLVARIHDTSKDKLGMLSATGLAQLIDTLSQVPDTVSLPLIKKAETVEELLLAV